MYAVTRLSFTFPKSKQLYAFFKKMTATAIPSTIYLQKNVYLGWGWSNT